MIADELGNSGENPSGAGMETGEKTLNEENILQNDERWKLILRIVATRSFKRADQLRRILLYISRFAILSPGEALREYDIACEPLARRPDFDPASDNIVRVQLGHLRRKLESYFAEEGQNESILVSIPKGSYVPVFELVGRSTATPADTTAATTENVDEPEHAVSEPVGATSMQRGGWSRRELLLAGALLVAVTAATAGFWRHSPITQQTAGTVPPKHNLFLDPLLKNGKPILIVVPDTSLSLIKSVTHDDTSVADYVSGFPQKNLAGVSNPDMLAALNRMARKKNTSFTEALLSFDLLQTLAPVTTQARLRYARDLHVRDFSDGNAIVIGNRQEDPWMQLFADRLNFRYLQRAPNVFYFQNAKPQLGEQSEYEPQITDPNDQIGYVDIALTRSLTEDGHMLLINGSDVQANETGIRLVLTDELPAQLKEKLNTKGVTSFEVLLRARHIAREVNNSFEIVAIRTN